MNTLSLAKRRLDLALTAHIPDEAWRTQVVDQFFDGLREAGITLSERTVTNVIPRRTSPGLPPERIAAHVAAARVAIREAAPKT